jgi:hypothetical protein
LRIDISASLLRFARDGAQCAPAAAHAILPALSVAVAHLPPDRAGVRIHGIAALAPILAADGAVGGAAAELLGADCRPVRAILFDKTPATNWALGWHQDRTICVVERREVVGFGPWSVKRGMHHVAPPFDLLAQMVTLRVHLDDVPSTNAPLLVAPESHRLGRIAVGEVEAVAQHCGSVACVAHAGDIWSYATPILHASAASIDYGRRRVLQIDYAAFDLPGGLRWLGIG